MTQTAHPALLLERIARLIHNDGHAAGLKPTQWEALRYLAQANRFSRNPRSVTAYLGMTKGTVSQTLSVLERKGLISKQIGAEDRRAVYLTLTPDGRAMLKTDPIAAFSQAIETLDPPVQDGFANTLETVLKQALNARGGRPFGACHNCHFFLSHDPSGTPHKCDLLNEALSKQDATLICFEQVDA